MSRKLIFLIISLVSLNVMWKLSTCEARYLPTRSQEDRLTKLRELLQELLKSEEKNSAQIKDQYDFNRGYLTAEELSAEEGYPILYDNRDDSRLNRRFYRQQIKQ